MSVAPPAGRLRVGNSGRGRLIGTRTPLREPTTPCCAGIEIGRPRSPEGEMTLPRMEPKAESWVSPGNTNRTRLQPGDMPREFLETS